MIALLLLAPVLAGQTIAADSPLCLLKRDHDYENDSSAFVPGTSPGCPEDWPLCGDSGICYNPAEGETCCPGGTYACPASSFCFLEPYCCPYSKGAEACAREYGIALTTSHLSNPTLSINSDFPPPPPPTLPPPSTSSASSITIRSTPIPTPASSIIAPWPSISIEPTTSVSTEQPKYTGGAAAGLSSRGAKEAVTLGAIVFGLLRNFL
ncbi:hypothetical protein BJY01DRAFT_221357 [Aspergillus pseudoustus]|uniref:Uncharacterized protein n=1 Tax=Aspergillus pseudoustus TaxID=1810923 RepID=A0ABR4JAI2_9EURO